MDRVDNRRINIMADHAVPENTNISAYRNTIGTHITNTQEIIDRIELIPIPSRTQDEKDILRLAKGTILTHKWIMNRFFT